MIVIGLTGGIGTGKSQASSILGGLGATVINADLVGHEVYKPHTEGWQAVVDEFGDGILTADEEVDRRKLGGIVFGDADALKRLNAIMHPRIYGMIEERIASLRDQERDVVVVEAAILFEANWTSLVDETWVTSSPPDQVVQRLKERNNMDEEAIRARIDSQMPQSERIGLSDVEITNAGSLSELQSNIETLWNDRVSAR